MTPTEKNYSIGKSEIPVSNPIDVGILSINNSNFSDTKNNGAAYGFGNNYGQLSDDIFYKFTINATTQVNISHCSSSIDTYMHLLDANGNLITSNDDNGPLCAGLQSSISISLTAGTYFVVSEGYGTNSGAITTSISANFGSTANSETYTEFIDNQMRYLDKSEIITGILYDRVNNLAGLNDFNVGQPDTSSYKHFEQSYFEMEGAAYNSSDWMPIEDLNALILAKKSIGQVPIGLSNYAFNLIDTNALDNNLFYMVDSVLYDTPNRSASPYQLVHNFIASPLLDSVPLSFSYYIGNEFMFQMSDKAISNIQIDFGDGQGLRTITLNSSIPVNYPSYGFKFLKFVIGFTDNSSMTTYGMVKCADYNLTIPDPNGQLVVQNSGGNPTPQSCNAEQPSFITSKIAFQGYDETSPTFALGNVRTYYATNGACDGIIRKPIIVIDGFDPGDTRSIEDLYNIDLNKVLPGSSLGFADNLRAQGYDLVILNFPNYRIGNNLRYYRGFPSGIPIPIMRDGGADYIERNAMTLIALIDSINTVKQGSEKLRIIGPSMGGLISRYALAYMEQNSMPHQTKLWVSFDSPHQGANIPIGDQRFLEFFAGLSPSAKENLEKKIGSVAARQMLLHHYTDGDANPQSPKPDNFRLQFVNNLNYYGFPHGDAGTNDFRKIALIDGSLGGNEVNIAGQKAFTFDTRHIKTRLFFFKVKIKTFTIASAKMYFTPSYGSTNDVLTAFKPFKNKNYSVIAPSYSSGFDNAPGGTFGTQEVLQQEGTGIVGTESSHTIAGKLLNVFTGGIFNVISTFYSVIPNHSFINTKSALAFSGSNQNLSDNISTRNLVCTGETPFDSYFGDFNENRQHVELWSDAVDWITKEINGEPQPPSANYQNLYSISGPTIVCNSTDYFINNLPSGATVTWSIPASAGGVMQLSQNTPSTNQLRITNQKWYDITTTLTATITIPSCNSSGILVTKTIQNDNSSSATSPYAYFQEACLFYNVSHPSQSGTVYSSSSPTFVHQGCMVYVDLGDMTGKTISFNGSTQPAFWDFGTTSYYQNTLYFQLPYGSGGIPFSFKITGDGACYDKTLLFFSYSDNSLYASNTNSTYELFPNPATNEITINAQKNVNSADNSTNVKSALESEWLYSLKIYDINNSKLLFDKQNIDKNFYSINVSNLIRGLYLLEITEGKEKKVIKFFKE